MPTHGDLTYNETSGEIFYNPYAKYHGEDTFTYQAFDGELTSNTVTVTLQVDTREGLSNSAIAGAIIGSLLGAAIIVFVIWFFVLRKNRNRVTVQ